MNYIFEDETTPPMQQIVINNPGTIVIQSPSVGTATTVPVYNDEIEPVDPSVTPDQVGNSIEIDGSKLIPAPYNDEVPEVKIDPKYNSYSNPVPRMPDQVLPPDPNLAQQGDPTQATNSSDQPFYNDELPPQDVAQQDLQNIPVDPATEIPVQQPFYNDEQPPIETPVDPNNQTEIPIDPSQQPVVGTPVMAQLPTDPSGALVPSQPVTDPSQIDPNTGMPTTPAIDPMTGMPMTNTTPGAIDPMTGMPTPGGIGMDGFTDESNPEVFVGNASAVTIGAPVPLQDLSRLNELKNINSQLMRIKGILEKELSKPYNNVEDKLNEAIEYFRSIISNLDSFSQQIDDIIMKYKRFILTILTQINVLKKQELDEKHGVKKTNKKEVIKKKNDKDKK